MVNRYPGSNGGSLSALPEIQNLWQLKFSDAPEAINPEQNQRKRRDTYTFEVTE